jgi:hypothetical protein
VGIVRIGSRLGAVAAILLSVAGLIAPAAMAAEGERVLDPQLSLIGGCKEETLDPVEDPGCPDTPPAGDHPSALFAFPRSVAVDPAGDIYVANFGKKENGSEGRIDIFGSDGRFISEIPIGVVEAPTAIAVDSIGTLYVWSEKGKLFRFAPCAPYDPAAGDIDYCNPPVVVDLTGPDCSNATLCGNRETAGLRGLAVNPANDHLFMEQSGQIVEYSSAAEGNEEVRWNFFSDSGTGFGVGLALDSVRHRLYAQEGPVIGIYDLAEGLPAQEEYEKIGAIEASSVPENDFGSTLALAVDEGTGHLFVFDSELTHLWELEEDGDYVATVEFPFESLFGTSIAIDNGATSPNGKLSEDEGKGRYLYVPSHPKKIPGHVFAFFESTVAAPEVKAAGAFNISEDEAELVAEVNPRNLATTYTFEVKPEGGAEWESAGGGSLAAGNLDAEASVAANGLTPGTHYRFRVVATNENGSDEAEGSFATYPSLPAEPLPCPNALLRIGASALLPDCRAYELVTLPDTNARAPQGTFNEGGSSTRQVSPAGDKVPFRIAGGALPGFSAPGSLVGDPYLATRTATGWATSYIGPSGEETTGDIPGINSPDQGYSFWGASGSGPALVEGKLSIYVRYPDGHSELVGKGTLGIEPEAAGWLISEGGGHIIFSTGARTTGGEPVQLEPEAPVDTKAVYDRSPDGVNHVISLKPDNSPFDPGEDAVYQGASTNGIGVAFEIEQSHTLYLRYNGEQTFEIGEGVQYAGISDGGTRVFYVEDGNLKGFDVATQAVIVFADTAAEVVPVTISADGSTAYFVSKTAIAGSGPNPEGDKPKSGAQNLYRSREGQIIFVGTVTARDVTGTTEGGAKDGLGLWLTAVQPVPFGLGQVPARSTPDGDVFLFKSRASLTGYDSEGHAEIYIYDSAAGQLRCLSCNPTGAAAHTDANLQSPIFTNVVWPENLRADGRRAFFETAEPLVARDSDGFQDVYEWEDQGVGSCSQPDGCLYLISSSQSRGDESLWAVSSSGDDVFFISPELLVGADADETPSIYDARVGGGFAETSRGVCEGEGCRPQLATPPALSGGDTAVRSPGDNVKSRACRKGKHKVKRAGKVRCVKKKHHRNHRHRRTRIGQKGGHR